MANPEGHLRATRDGGRTWTEEPVVGGMPPSAVTISLDGEFITALDYRAVRLYRRFPRR